MVSCREIFVTVLISGSFLYTIFGNWIFSEKISSVKKIHHKFCKFKPYLIYFFEDIFVKSYFTK